MSTKLEINFTRLLNRCEKVAADKASWDWRLEKVILIKSAKNFTNQNNILLRMVARNDSVFVHHMTSCMMVHPNFGVVNV